MFPSRNTRGIVLLVAGVLLAVAATRRRRFGVSRPSRIGIVAGVALALIGLRRLLRSRRAWQSEFDAQHDPGTDDWGFGSGLDSAAYQVRRAATSARQEFQQAASRVFG